MILNNPQNTLAYKQFVLDKIAEISSDNGNRVQPDLAQNDSTQPDYVKNRTHWEESQTVIEWDGNTEGKDTIPIDVYGPFILCKVSDLTPTKEELISGKYRIAEGSTEFDATPLTESDFYEGDGCLIAGNRLVVVSKTTAIAENGAVWEFPSTGLYAKNRPGLNRFASVTYGANTVHQIDEKFIPESIARTSQLPAPAAAVADAAGETPTAAEFNALLAALRSAGYLAT